MNASQTYLKESEEVSLGAWIRLLLIVESAVENFLDRRRRFAAQHARVQFDGVRDQIADASRPKLDRRSNFGRQDRLQRHQHRRRCVASAHHFFYLFALSLLHIRTQFNLKQSLTTERHNCNIDEFCKVRKCHCQPKMTHRIAIN